MNELYFYRNFTNVDLHQFTNKKTKSLEHEKIGCMEKF